MDIINKIVDWIATLFGLSVPPHPTIICSEECGECSDCEAHVPLPKADTKKLSRKQRKRKSKVSKLERKRRCKG